MSPESFQERPDQKTDAAEAKALADAGAKQKPDGTWEATCDLGKSGAGSDITTVQFRKIHGIWQWTNNSEPAGKWLGSPRFPTEGAGISPKAAANRDKMNKLADALGVKTDANKQNEINAKETKTLSDAGATQRPDGTWETTSALGKSGTGTDITTVQFRKVHDTWQWTNNSEPAGKWFGSPRFPTNGTDLPPDVKANRERMNKLADALGVKANAQLEGEQALQVAIDDYLAKEKVAADAGITPDVEYHVSWIDDSLGYVPFLEHVLEEMKDKDEWLADGSNEAQLEKNLLQSTAQSIRKNLNGLSKALDAAPQKSGKAYEHLRSIYLERAKRYTELTASVNEDEENVELRDATLATQQAAEMLPHMTMDEAIDWVKQALSSIDGNDWQSGGLKETYGKLINTCKAALQEKLAQEKGEIGNDPAKASAFCGHAMELAKLFTDRGSPIDSGLTDIDFAEGMAKDAMGFEELAMRYVEKTLSEKNPLKKYVSEKKGGILAKFAALPPENRNEQIANIETLLNGNPTDVAGISEQYALLRNIEAQMNGQTNVNANVIQGEINKEFTPFLESAYVKFETFLDGTIGGAANLQEINAAIGEPGLNPMQVEAWQLLSDIQGYGYDVSDKTWSYVAMGAKIAAMIAAGIAVGIATGGLGVVAAALAGGTAMTGVNAVINQQGFDNLEDAFKTYGKDFAVNAATMGAARYLAAGRTAFQLSRAGLLPQAGGLSTIFSIAGKAGGAKLLGSLDDASSLGIRMFGAAGEGLGDLGIGTALDTTIKGGEFMENLQNNAMFFGLSFAEFGQQGIGGLWKKLRSAPDEQLHGLSQLVNKANLGRMNIHKLSGGIHVEDLLSSTDPAALLKKGGVDDKELKQIFEELDGLKKTKAEFEEAFKKAAALPDAPDVAAPQSDEEKIESIKKTIMDLPDTPEGLAKRVEAGAFVLGGKPGDLTPAQSQAILDAHAVPMADGQKYSMAELKQKMQILEAGGFTREQADTLLRMGVCGVPPPPPVPPKKNAFGVPPPPPVPSRPGQTPSAPRTPPSLAKDPAQAPASPINKQNTQISRPANTPSATPRPAENVPQSVKKSVAALNEKEIATQNNAVKYGNLPPERAALTPKEQEMVRSFQQRGITQTQVYMEGPHQGHPDQATSDKNVKSTNKNYIINDGNPGQKDRGIREDMRKIGAVESVIFRPLTIRPQTTKTETYVAKEGGWFKKPTMGTRQVVVSGAARPMQYTEAVEGTTSKEPAVRVTYLVAGDEYKSGFKTYEDTLDTRNTVIKKDPVSKKQTFVSTTDETSQIEEVMTLKQKVESPDFKKNGTLRLNQIAISIILPESEARALQAYLSKHPDRVRPFFLNAGMHNMTYHIPPPYDRWDTNARPILMREMNDNQTVKQDSIVH